MRLLTSRNAVDPCTIHFASISFLIFYDPYRWEIQRQILNFDRMHMSLRKYHPQLFRFRLESIVVFLKRGFKDTVVLVGMDEVLVELSCRVPNLYFRCIICKTAISL